MSAREGYVKDLPLAEQRALAARTRKVERLVKSRRRKAAAKSFFDQHGMPLGLLVAAAAIALLIKRRQDGQAPVVSGASRQLSIAEAFRLL